MVKGQRGRRMAYYTRLALLRARQGNKRSAYEQFINLIGNGTNLRIGRVAAVLRSRGAMSWKGPV